MNKHVEIVENMIVNLTERIEDWRVIDSPQSKSAVRKFTEEKEALEWLLEAAGVRGSGKLDITSELEVGDKVVSLIDYMEDVRKGMVGTVVKVRVNDEYPMLVQLDIRTTMFDDGQVGFKRDELGKVWA